MICDECKRPMEEVERFTFSDADANHENDYIRNTYRAAVAAGIELDGEWATLVCQPCGVTTFVRTDEEEES